MTGLSGEERKVFYLFPIRSRPIVTIMRSALFFLLSIGLHAAALAYPAAFAPRGHSEAIRVTILPEEPEPAGGGSGGNGQAAAPSKPKPAFAGTASNAPRVEAKPLKFNPVPQRAAAAEIETVSESSVNLTSTRGFPSDRGADLASDIRLTPGGISGPGGNGAASNGIGAGTGSGGGHGAGLGSGSGGAGRGETRTEARYRDTPRPEYPESARRQGLEGRVLLRVLVDERGRSKQVEINHSSGSAALDRAAAEAIRRWRFDPARLGEQPIESWLRIPIEFRLTDAKAW